MDIQVVNRALRDINDSFLSLIMERNYQDFNGVVSWPNYEPGISNSLVYAAEYQRLIDKKQFSFLMMDKSFFQFYFRFNGAEITSAKLAYYPCPVKISGAMEDIVLLAEDSGIDLLEELYYGAESWIDRGIDIVNTSHVRLDFDSEVTRHAPCHLQFGGLQEFRVPSSKLINPFVFFEWVCKSINADNLTEAIVETPYLRSIGYHLSRNLVTTGVEENYPHLASARTPP